MWQSIIGLQFTFLVAVLPRRVYAGIIMQASKPLLFRTPTFPCKRHCMPASHQQRCFMARRLSVDAIGRLSEALSP